MTTAICDAGPLIALAKLRHLHLLRPLHPRVLIPQPVYVEVVLRGKRRGALDAQIAEANIVQFQWEVLPEVELGLDFPAQLGAGERSAISLATVTRRSLLLIDDELARTTARRLGLRVRGTIGVLVEAHHKGTLNWEQTDLLLQELAIRPDIWIGRDLIDRVRDQLVRDKDR